MNALRRFALVMLLLAPLHTMAWSAPTAPQLPDQYAEVVLHVEGMI